MKKPITLSVRDLRRADACTDQIRSFKHIFGDKALATVTNAVAHAHIFDWDWAAQAMLTSKFYDAYYARLRAWSWDPWRVSKEPGFGHLLTEDGLAANERHKAGAFAIEYLRQGGMPPAPRTKRRREPEVWISEPRL